MNKKNIAYMDLKEQHIVWIGGAAILSMFGFAN